MSTSFKVHGFRCLSNYGVAEIQISDDGSMARLRYYKQEPTRWLAIQYDSRGEPFVEYKTYREYLNQFAKMRPLYEIAKEIRKDWKNVYFGAKPYLDAMFTLDSVHDHYYLDSGESIVRYFLANAAMWRGETARRIKAELKQMLKS